MIELNVSKGRINVRLRALFMGKDLCILIDGGDMPHMGAISLCHGNTKEMLQSINIPKHKEYIITEDVSKRIQQELGYVTCCICGIHITNITKQEIESVVCMSQELTTSLMRELKNKLNTSKSHNHLNKNFQNKQPTNST